MELDNILPLCRHCHGCFDSGLLDVLPYLTLEEQLEVVRQAGGIGRAYARLTSSL